jgi:hypothetical protein
MTTHTCAISGDTSTTKHYVLRTTEGDETVSPEALFHTRADREMGRIVLDLARRVGVLERALARAGIEDQDEDQDHGDSEEKAPQKEDQGEEKKAAPAKKATPAKKAPAQRKATD